MANNNLFYQLYSTNNSVADSGYTCSSAVDETATSFDISASNGEITDSNGNTLQSIDLSQVHAEGLTQYNTETRILQPYSCCVLQGLEYGLARAEYWYAIPGNVAAARNYGRFLSCDLDFLYNEFRAETLHISTKADGSTDICEAVNGEFDRNGVKATATIRNITDAKAGTSRDYLVFSSQQEGYFFYIANLKISPAFQSPEFPKSPFSNEVDNVKTLIYNALEKHHPVKKGESYDKGSYEVPCRLYKWMLANFEEAVRRLGSFDAMLSILSSITSESDVQAAVDEANAYIRGTVYDNDAVFNPYDVENLYRILDAVKELADEINRSRKFYLRQYWLREDCSLRVPLMKYPNGAFRGIVLVPDFPKDSEYDYCSLWVNHIRDTVRLYSPLTDGHYAPKRYAVLSNATLSYENKDKYRAQSNVQLLTAIEDGWERADGVCCHQEHTEPDDPVYMGGSRYMNKRDVIGLFRYMQHVNDEDLWNKVGEMYIVVGKDDDPQSKTRNLPTSLLIYNPNPIPVRIKYMVFV